MYLAAVSVEGCVEKQAEPAGRRAVGGYSFFFFLVFLTEKSSFFLIFLIKPFILKYAQSFTRRNELFQETNIFSRLSQNISKIPRPLSNLIF